MYLVYLKLSYNLYKEFNPYKRHKKCNFLIFGPQNYLKDEAMYDIYSWFQQYGGCREVPSGHFTYKDVLTVSCRRYYISPQLGYELEY